MKIQLTQGKVALIDAVDLSLISQYRWYAKLDHGMWYARTNIRKLNGQRTVLTMHNLIMGGKEIDHKNNNGLDNRRANLRFATDSQNQANTGPQINNTSGFKGVSWHKGGSKWQAQITTNGKHLYLGLYETKEEAAKAYDEAARHYFGEFAKLNHKDKRNLDENQGKAEEDFPRLRNRFAEESNPSQD